MAALTEHPQRADTVDDDNFLRSSRRFRITAEVVTLMLQGAGYAALVCTAILFASMLLLALSRALPDASKEAPDPTPELSMAEPAEVSSLA